MELYTEMSLVDPYAAWILMWSCREKKQHAVGTYGHSMLLNRQGLLFFNSICGNLRSITYVSSQLDNASLSKALINRAEDVYRPEQEELEQSRSALAAFPWVHRGQGWCTLGCLLVNGGKKALQPPAQLALARSVPLQWPCCHMQYCYSALQDRGRRDRQQNTVPLRAESKGSSWTKP